MEQVKKFKKRVEIKSPQQVLQELMESLDARIIDYSLARVLGEVLPKETMPPDLAPMMLNTDQQIEHMKSARKILEDIVLEHRIFETKQMGVK